MEARDHRQTWRHRGDRSRDPALRRLNHCVETILGLLPVLLVSLALAETTVADPFEDAAAAYDRGDYAAALSVLRPLADAGDRRAQNGLGAMYTTGHGVPRDYAEALKWYRKAAEQGLPVAQVNLAEMYLEGLGAPRDDVAAATWFRKSADQGNADAQVGLGALYVTGQGVPQDYAEAAKWYRMAADLGFAAAQNNLGFLCQEGRGVQKDVIEAFKWFSLAASRHSDSETASRDGAIGAAIDRQSLARVMTPAQIAEAERLVGDWKQNRPWRSDRSSTYAVD